MDADANTAPGAIRVVVTVGVVGGAGVGVGEVGEGEVAGGIVGVGVFIEGGSMVEGVGGAEDCRVCCGD